MNALPSQKRTTDYSKFEMHITNRVTHDEEGYKPRKDLLDSMKRDGFWPQSPIVCEKLQSGKLKILDGHNRFITAMSLGIPVDYLAYEQASVSPIKYSLGQKQWRIDDYISAYIQQDIDEYVEIDDYCKRTGISRNAAICMFTNNLPSSGNAAKPAKTGRLTIKNRDLPETVGHIVMALSSHFDWARTSSCLNAIARCVLTPGFEPYRLAIKINKYVEHIKKQPSMDDYLRQFESIYNRHNKGDYFPLVANSSSAIRARNKLIAKKTEEFSDA